MAPKRKQLVAQAKESIAEIHRLAASYRNGIDTLERVTLPEMSVAAVREWFRLVCFPGSRRHQVLVACSLLSYDQYLRIVDIGVQIRRGEIRHRTKHSSVFSCLHKTGTKGATHSGMSIDDANSAYRILESEGMNEDRLERLFLGVDELDRDFVGGMDKQLVQCFTTLLRQKSTAYVRLELTGTDPHQALVVVPARSSRPLPPVTRMCFSPDSCSCLQDAEPWVDFVLSTHEENENGDAAEILATKNVYEADITRAQAIEVEEVGINELKRKFGFEPQLIDVTGNESESDNTLPKRKRIFVRNRVPSSGNVQQAMNTTSELQRLSPKEIYLKHCQQVGSTPQAYMRQIFVVKNGALRLNYTGLALPTQSDTQAILHVIKSAQLAVQSIGMTNTFLNAQAFGVFCEWLQLPIVRLHLQELNLRCLGLPQRKSYAELLDLLADLHLGELGYLKNLDLSFWNFTQDIIRALDTFLHLPQVKKLGMLYLASCFTKGHDLLESSVDSFLSVCSNSLKTLDLSANYVSIQNLNSLFAPKKSLEVLRMKNMVIAPFDDSQVTSTWDFSQLLVLEFSEAYDSIVSAKGRTATDIIMRALSTNFTHQDMQIKCVDLVIHGNTELNPTIPVASMAESTTDLLLRIQEYGKLLSLRFRFFLPVSAIMLSAIECAQHYSALVRLFSGGLLECETLELHLGIPLTLKRFRTLVSSAQLPKVTSMHLSILLDENVEQDCQVFGFTAQESEMSFMSFFLSANTLRDVVIEWLVPTHSRTFLSSGVFEELENAWKSSSTNSSSDQLNVHSANLTKKRVSAQAPDTQDMEKITMYFSVD